ncbi:hypothetical protein QBC33DRAFT_533828 [Phialemonium atrogriseum]|uniref:Uncharacterized protein n=1 Tax=Phialemonium atrogriseum TaxID=1093897 RepID=A0AAJ0C296_9PEZI|nr:uncharacterized protein QBC33DRAFT_533828 [Phialemonium atrogriseum]KAK1768830.1 hypothetical protein QBC33DRAFT_533828 [Phialemonium atrogriseum]
MDSSKNTQQQEKKPEQQPGDSARSKVQEGVESVFEHHKAAPGPAVPKDFNVAQEGTKEERKAKAQELNK